MLKVDYKHEFKRGWGAKPRGCCDLIFFIVLVKKFLSLSFELMKSNFTTVGPLEKNFLTTPWKNPSDAHAGMCCNHYYA